MITRLFKVRKKISTPAVPAVPNGTAIWAVGDIHGRLDLLQALTEAIMSDAKAVEASRKVVIFLGDYVDRGPDSRGVIRHLANLPSDQGVEWRFLMGNHEETMLQFIEDPSIGPRWCEYGGDATIQSYGLRLPQIRHQAAGWAHVSADLDHRLDKRERAFLEELEMSISIGDYFFVHAGARPGTTLDRQDPHDLMWIRRTFLDSDIGFEQVVVHGHTPTEAVHADHRRIGIDTKAYESGVLTAVRFIRGERMIFQATSENSRELLSAVRVATVPLTVGVLA